MIRMTFFLATKEQTLCLKKIILIKKKNNVLVCEFCQNPAKMADWSAHVTLGQTILRSGPRGGDTFSRSR